MLILDKSCIGTADTIDIIQPSLQRRTHNISEKSKKSKRLNRLLKRALVHKRRGPQRTATVVVVLCGEDEGREPEVGEDPGEGGAVAFVAFHSGESDGGDVEEGVDGGDGEPVD